MRVLVLIVILVLTAGFIFRNDLGLMVRGQQSEKITKIKKEKKEPEQASPGVSITNKWELPAELLEISGLAWIDKDRFACVQDEEGTVFIYNRAAGQIEKRIPFAGAGDYEGITLNGNMAYIVRADGHVYEVDMTIGKTSAKEYSTPLTAEHNVEGLTYDKKNNRLLLAIKNGEPGNKDYKGIYAFDLSAKTLNMEPVVKIDLQNSLLQSEGGKKNKSIMPSALGIHPRTSEYYITDGPKSRLMIMDASGNIKKLVSLGKDFAQPEGITFSPEGDIFISNEGTKQSANILQVVVD